MVKYNVIESVVFEWKGVFEVDDNIGGRASRDVGTDCTGSFV